MDGPAFKTNQGDFMKQKKTANLLMVLIILAIVIAGITAALALKEHTTGGLGSAYKIQVLSGTPGEGKRTCTITIVCDTILDNLNRLNQEKAPYVPTNGIVLPEAQVSFHEGATVLDILKAVCDAASIQLEYSWSPAYNSSYVEGINHLYEFDCGPESGWMYQVNGVFPNYGCSRYLSENGDNIVWCYTSTGLGKDVGNEWMGNENEG